MNPQKKKTLIRNVGIFITLLPVTVFALIPIYWAFNTSLKPETRIVTTPPEWIPKTLTLDNYEKVLTQTSLPRYYINTIFTALITIIVTLVVGAHAGFAAARFEFKGKNFLMFVLLSTVMVPGIVTLIPQYMIAIKTGLHNTFTVLFLVYSAWQVPTVIWLLQGFFETIPRDLDDAALIDGCSHLGAFYRVILPISQPGIAAAAIMVFVYVWNAFLIALNLTASDATRPLTVGLYFFVSEAGILWGKLSAGASLALLPVLIVFLLLQKRFIKGLVAGAIKG